MLNSRLMLTSVSPLPLWSVYYDKPRTGIRSSALSAQQRYGGTGTVLSVILPVIRILYHRIRNSPEPDEDSFLTQQDKTLIHHYEE
jgi:hypothetical protein